MLEEKESQEFNDIDRATVHDRRREASSVPRLKIRTCQELVGSFRTVCNLLTGLESDLEPIVANLDRDGNLGRTYRSHVER